MRNGKWLLLVVWISLAAFGAEPEAFDLHVAKVRMGRDQPGDLHVDLKGISFRSADGKSVVRIPMRELREADVANFRALRFGLYRDRRRLPGERDELVFHADAVAPVEQLAKFFAAHILRPVVGHYEQAAKYEVAAYHKRVLGGSSGTLRMGIDFIAFASDTPADSRTWLFQDIETIGRPDAYRFRVTTGRESYVLELKERLPEEAYRAAWNGVYDRER